jgi:glutaredoxin
MKKIIIICIVGILLGTTFGAATQIGDEENQTRTSQTHKVLGEYGTATWCGYCKYAHGALKALKAGFWHDFYYVSLVDDKNIHADARNTEMGITGFPTVWWDGKYRTNIGAGSIPSAMAAYNASILACGARTVPNIDLTVHALWLGSATMSITVTLTNYETSTYTGYLRCYVTEIVSSMGWIDTAGNPYTFPFLDYAFNQIISAPGGGTWSNTVTWVGADHTDGYGHTFSGITQANTFIVAAVFASSGGYVDEADGYRLGSNSAPNAPNTPNPTDGATNVAVSPTLKWQCTDPEWYDTLYFDVYLEQNDTTPDVLVSEHQTGRSFKPNTLNLETTYYWQIVATDSLGLTSTGPVWSFTTRGNNPPNTPSNPNPSNGSTGVPLNKILSWTGGDPNGDTVKYDVYFGKTNPPSKVTSNQSATSYNPGSLDPLTTFYWKIVAWDSFGATSTGPVWQFITSTAPNHPPNTPDISGPSQGKKGVTYTYNVTGTDPDGNNI